MATLEKIADQPQHTEWYRLALLLTGDATVAGSILVDTLVAAAGHVTELREENRRRAWLARQLLSRAKKAVPTTTPGSAPVTSHAPETPWAKVGALPENARNAFALFHCIDGDLDETAEIMGVKPIVVTDSLAEARATLAPGVALPTEAKVRFHRPWGDNEPKIAKAAKAAQENPEQKTLLNAQVSLDREWHEAISHVNTPSTLELPALEPTKPAGFRNVIRQPVVLAMVIALLVVLGSVAFLMKRKLDEFPGREVIAELVDNIDEMTGTEIEQISPTECGKLGDWFMLKGYDGFSVPPEFEHVKAVGCRVFQLEGHPVAQVALDRPENPLLFHFRADDFKMKLDSANWKVFQQEDWAVAVRGNADTVWVVAFIGDSGDMEKLLRTLVKKL